MFHFSQQAALEALDQFMPHAGEAYARSRNYEYGPNARINVSMLSPWVRLRLIPEWQLISTVLDHHSVSHASKFIDEVCWRTYWKGWLSRRPTVWQDYCTQLAKDQVTAGDLPRYVEVISAASGIDCLDAWSRELIDTGYLHNHARMWFASIWVHTLQLPWSLGADFFLRHLLDGDAATNTLSWRWVAGLHTAGKTYLATADNISHYSKGRFNPQIKLATVPVDVTDSAPNPPAQPYERLAPIPSCKQVGLLLHEEDVSALSWLYDQAEVRATAGLIPKDAYQRHRITQSVFDFRHSCLCEASDGRAVVHTDVEAVVEWAVAAQLDLVLMAEPAVGIWDQVVPELLHALQQKSIQLAFKRHWWDEHFYPHAQAGFFRFKKAIPGALDQLVK